MSPELQRLIHLQDIDVRIFELTDRLAAIPLERRMLEEQFRQARKMDSRSNKHARMARSRSMLRNAITNGSTARHAPKGSEANRKRSTIGVMATRAIWKNQMLGKLNQPRAR